MRALWVLTRLRLQEVFRVPISGALFFGLPLLLFVTVGLIFANGHPYERRRVAVVGETPAGLADFPEVHVSREGSAQVALAKLRVHLVNAVLLEHEGNWRLCVGSGDQLLGRGLVSVLPGKVALDMVERPRWGFVHFVFPGLIGFTVVMSGLFGLGYTIARYRQNLFLRKLSTTPLSKTTFLASQILGRSGLVLAQCGLLLVAAHFIFQLPLSPLSAALTLLLTALGLLVFLGVGLLLACLIRTEGLLYDLISSVAWPLVLLSEMFFPADELPPPLAQLAGALPSTQLVRMLRSVLLFGDLRWETLAPGLAILLVWTVLTLGAGWALFRWNDS